MDTLAETETEKQRALACAALDECVRTFVELAARARTAAEIERVEMGIAHIMSSPRRLRDGRTYVAFLSAEHAEVLRMARTQLALRSFGAPRRTSLWPQTLVH